MYGFEARGRAVAPVRAVLVLALAALLVAPARAEAQSAEAQAAAEVLFREGRRLLDEGHVAQACRKFEASYQLDVALGTLLNLANCLELEGRLASAWARFVEAETRSRRAGSAEREQVAHARAGALEARLVRLRLDVPTPAPGMRVDVGGREFGPALWNTPIPIDPGEVTITASADGYEPFTRTVQAAEEGSTIEVEIPPLVPVAPVEEATEAVSAGASAAAEPVTAVAPESQPRRRSVRRITGYAVLGAGVAALAVGLGVGQSARSLWRSADCPPMGGDRICVSRGDQADAEHARTRANVSTGVVVAGGALAAAAIVVLVTGRHHDADDEAAERVRVTPVASANGAGILIGGAL
jgi:hypothetical protein